MLLKAACQARDIEIMLYDPSTFDFVKQPAISHGDLVYRAATDIWPRWSARAVEQQFTKHDVRTFYRRNNITGYVLANPFFPLETNNIPVPKTIPHVSKNRRLLRTYVDYLGGFPIVVKVMGGSRGRGVLRVDSYQSLFSIIDYVTSSTQAQVAMRQCIITEHSGRLIVLGDAVIASIQFTAQSDDFRANVRSRVVKHKTYTNDIERIAIKAAHVRGFDFAGVDIIFDEKGNPYITEVNFPCRFTRAHNVTGIDIAGKMVDFLSQKPHY